MIREVQSGADCTAPQQVRDQRRLLIAKRDRLEEQLAALARRVLRAEAKLMRAFKAFERLRKDYGRLDKRLQAIRQQVPSRKERSA